MNETASVRTVTTPEWFTKGSIYQINPRTFSKEGTVRAVTRELPYLRDLGFTVMYLCPIFEEDDSTDPDYHSERQKKSETGNPKNPYRMNDYFRIDSEYGTLDDLGEFVREAHGLGLKVMLDLVYLHIGPNATILRTHPEFARRDETGTPVLTKWKFPYLNFESEGLREYLLCNMVYYVSVFDVDGFRCDVGDKVPLDFWIEGRRRIRAVKPDAVLLNEGSDFTYLEQGFDASYSFAWHRVVYKAFRNEATAMDVRACHEEMAAQIPAGAYVMRDIDNHDTVTDWPERTELSAGHDGMELIEVLNYTIDGIPMVYCGNELCDEKKLSMFANRFFPGRFDVTDRETKDAPEVRRRTSVLRTLNALKRTERALSCGETVWLVNDAPDSVLSYLRVYGGERIVTVANLSSDAVRVTVEGLDPSCGETLLEGLAPIAVDGGALLLPPHGYLVRKLPSDS